ncbi:MAG: hypothetical protein GY937_21250, partial [bacterium]|nr:hypothetical protein [bacterium]
INEQVDTTVPTVTGVTNPASADIEKVGGKVDIELILSESVTLTDTKTATVVLLIDKADGSGTREVTATATGNGTASDKLTFTTATLPAGLSDSNGVKVKADSLSFTSQDFKDAAGNDVSTTFVEKTAINEQVDTTVPTVTGVTNPASADIEKVGGKVDIELILSESVTLTDTK